MFVSAQHDTDLTFFTNQHVTRKMEEIMLSPQFDSFSEASVTSLCNASSCLCTFLPIDGISVLMCRFKEASLLLLFSHQLLRRKDCLTMSARPRLARLGM